MAKRPPSSCTIGRSSGGITGTASSTIHSGLFSEVMNALTTFSRLIARCCFCPFDVLIVSRSMRASACEVEVAEQVADRLRPHAAAEVDAEAVRRAEAVLELAEQLLVVDDQLRLELAEQLPCLLEPPDALHRRPRARPRGALDVRAISRTFVAHCVTTSRSSLRAPSTRQRSEASSRTASGLGRRAARRASSAASAQQAVADLASALEVLRVDRRDQLGVVALELLAGRAARPASCAGAS